jgi:hypothetical protein
MSYLVAALADRRQVEAAAAALAKAGLSKDRVNILGQGFQGADDYGFIDPIQSVRKAATQKITWIVPFGFLAGFAFNWLTGIAILDRVPAIGNQILGGIFGAAAGGLGAYLNSVNVGIIDSDETLPYRNRLAAGQYLIIVKGTDEITDRATNVLKEFELEKIQGYPEQNATTSS